MSPRRAALIRLVRGLAYAVLATAVSFLMVELPALGDVIPSSEVSVPVLMALLLALDKWVRAKRAEALPPSPPPE